MKNTRKEAATCPQWTHCRARLHRCPCQTMQQLHTVAPSERPHRPNAGTTPGMAAPLPLSDHAAAAHGNRRRKVITWI